MKKIRVVIGANFGDEGKGLMTDYFCEQLGGNVLNVRFNATSQAGHTVNRNGKRHVFSHFGSGSMINGVATYLSSDFYFNPVRFFEELEELKTIDIIPKVFICEKSEAVTIYDIFFNCIIEEARGKERHGSCGAGLWEAVNRVKAGISITAGEINTTDRSAEYKRKNIIREKLILIRDEYYAKRFEEMKIDFNCSSEWYEIWYSDTGLENYIDMLFDMGEFVTVVNEEEILNKWDNQVYEGAQGLLLDYDNREYMPNLTASFTGSRSVIKLLNIIKGGDREREDPDIEICYVTRTYFTRHGAGRFETETSKEELDPEGRLSEETNITNRWQGGFRWGYFDGPLFLKSVKKDMQIGTDGYRGKIKYKVSFTHTNCTDRKLLMPDGRTDIEKYIKELPENICGLYCCDGKTAETVRKINE